MRRASKGSAGSDRRRVQDRRPLCRTSLDVRRLLFALICCALLAAAAPSFGSTPRLERQLLVFSYDGKGPALLSVEGSVEAIGRPGYLASVAADGEGSDLTPFFPDLVELGEDGAPLQTYGAVGAHDLCLSPVVTCDSRAGSSSLQFGISFSVGKSSSPVHIRMVVALEGTRVRASHVEIGWKARKRLGGFSRVTTGGTGVRTVGTSLEALPTATLPGGRGGSIAVAVPPCDQVGAGIVTLTGAKAASTTACPTGPFAAAAVGVTRWSMAGTAAGMSTYRTRLLVFDL
jgi:hypothetical protein